MIFNKEKFIEPENYEFKINNESYIAIFDASIEEDAKGYIVHNLSIVKDDLMVGYLRFFYLPTENKNYYYENILYYLNTKGHLFDLRKKDGLDNIYENKTIEEKEKTIERVAMTYNYGYYNNILEKIKILKDNPIELEKLLDLEYKNLIKLMFKKYKEKYEKDVKTYHNNPLPEFIKVRKKGDKMFSNYDLNNLRKYAENKGLDVKTLFRESDLSFIGKGLGKKLYKLTADWLALNKLSLQKGGTNEYSERFWSEVFEKNKNEFNLKNIDGVLKLDHSNFDLSYLKIPENNKKIIKKKNKIRQ